MQFNESRLTAAIETARTKANGNRALLDADDTAALRGGLKVLCEHLKQLAFYTPRKHYKADIRHDAVWVRVMV